MEQLPAALCPKTAEHNFSQSCKEIQGGTKASYCSLWGPNWVLKPHYYYDGDAAHEQLLRKASLSLESFKTSLSKATADPVLAITLLQLEGQAG